MAQQVKSRTPRRMEKKQALLLVVLLLGISLISFFLGIMVGRSSSSSVAVSSGMVTKPMPVIPASLTREPEELPVVQEKSKKEVLTFYDALSKGEQVPLGSGINLPPETKKVVSLPTSNPAPVVHVAEVSPLSGTPAVTASAVAKSVVKGTYLVQVASFQKLPDATRVRDQLAKKEYEVFIQQADLGDRGIWHRIVVGPYAGREAAGQVLERLKNEEKFVGMVKRQ
jgi:DedD protein